VDKAIDYAVRAGKRATSLLAYEEAASHYERALQALELKEFEETQRCELLLALGDAQRKAGDAAKAKETFRRAADIARKLGASEQLARAALGFGEVSFKLGIVDEIGVGLLEEALSALGEKDSALRARVLARLAHKLYFSAASAERRALLSQEAVEMARRVGDTTALASVLDNRHWALWGPENVEDRLATATEILQLAEKSGNKEMALQGHYWRLIDLLELGDIPAGDIEIEACAGLAEELRQPHQLWYVALAQAMRSLLAGRFEETEQLTQQALAIGQRAQDPDAAPTFGVQIFALRREQGRLQELEAAVEGFIEQYPALPSWRCALALLYRELGREAEARAEFEHLAASDFAGLPQDQLWLISVTILSEVCVFLGDIRRAETLYQLLLPYAGRNVTLAEVACVGPASYYLGLLATAVARWEEAVRHFEDALEMNAKMGQDPRWPTPNIDTPACSWPVVSPATEKRPWSSWIWPSILPRG
jgi:tetratricopeptide (TPR) repeat protein